MKPRVSVIIPSFESGPLLERAVRSVLAQTVEDFEVIVVDDGSKRPQPEIVHLDARVRFVAQPNRGVSVARNVGVLAARADLVAFLDHDDEWESRKLERQFALVESFPDAALWCTSFWWVRGDDEERSGSDTPTYHGLLSNQMILLSSVLVRAKDYLELGGQNPVLAQHQDWDMFLRLSMDRPSPAIASEPLVRYYLHDNNASRDYRRSASERLGILEQHALRAWARHDRPALRAIAAGRARTRELYAFQAVDAARAAHGRGEWRQTLSHLGFATRMSPGVLARSIRALGSTRLAAVGMSRRHQG